MKIELPEDINLLALHNFAQQQGCRIQQTAHGDMVMKRTILKFPNRKLTSRPVCRPNLKPDGPGAA